MHFVWDKTKNRKNLAKHSVSCETAKLVFDDPFAVSSLDRVVDGEERWHTMGLVSGSVVLLVVHTFSESNGEETIRIISARKATSLERKIYGKSD